MQEYRPRPSARARELLEGLLADYRLRPGDRLPSERSLSDAWGLSRTTLRSAVALMEQDGRLLSMSQSAAEQGRQVTTRLLELRRTECDKHLARRFNQVLGYPLYKIVRLRSVDGEPLMVETSYIPAQKVAGLENKDLENHSLFSILEEDFGILPVQGEEEIGITYATAEEAELMGIESGSPLFWIVSMTYDQTGQLMEYCRGAARPDRLRITTVMECQEEEADSNEA